MRKSASRLVAATLAAVALPVLAGAAWADYWIYDNPTGGDGHLIGTWDAATRTLTLTQDLTDPIHIVDPGITLDGAGHRIVGHYAGDGDWRYRGIHILSTAAGTRVHHCSVEGFYSALATDGQTQGALVEDNVLTRCGANASGTGITFRNNMFTGYGTGLFGSQLSDTTIEGNTFIDGPIYLSEGTRITIRGNEITGCATSESGSDAMSGGVFQMYGVRDSVVEDNRVHDNQARGMNFRTDDLPGQPPANNHVTGNRVERNWWGISLSGSDNVVSGNTSTGNFDVGIQLCYDGADNLVEGNTTTGNGAGVWCWGYGSGTIVRSNHSIDDLQFGINVGGTNVLVEDNDVSGGGARYAIGIGGDGGTCRRNVAEGARAWGFSADGTNILVEGNTATRCAGGIYQEARVGPVTFRGNRVGNCTSEAGIYVRSNATADGNVVVASRGPGILVMGSDNSVTGNTIDDNAWGVVLGAGIADPRGNVVSGNLVRQSGQSETVNSSSGFGLYVAAGRELTIERNRIETSRRSAIYVEHCEASTVAANTISDNGNEWLGSITVSSACHEIRIEENELLRNVGPAVSVGGDATYLLRNRIADTVGPGGLPRRGIGISTVASWSGTIAHNVVTGGSGAAIELQSWGGGLIYDNRFECAETVAPNPAPFANAWSVAKTAGPNVMGGPWIGGNFWGTTAGTGWSQVTPDNDGDGFCNAPFVIGPGNVDLLPLARNTAPSVNPTGAGVYEMGSSVTLGAAVADNDGDLLTWTWRRPDGSVLATGTVQAPAGGAPIALPDRVISTSDLGLGLHPLTIEVDDGQRQDPVVCEVLIEVTDTTKPSLAPVADVAMLWPPDHRLVAVTIDAHASDNDGAPVLAAAVTSSEADDGLGDGDTANDVQNLAVDQETGRVTVDLRAERSGKGTGRVYTVTFTATDRSGNVSITSLTVLVPRSKGQGGN